MTDKPQSLNNKPIWDELYSVAASTWNHFVWIDLSLLYDCPKGIILKSYLSKDGAILVDNDFSDERGYGKTTLIKGIEDKWLEWQSKATEHCNKYNKWQKKYGKR